MRCQLMIGAEIFDEAKSWNHKLVPRVKPFGSHETWISRVMRIIQFKNYSMPVQHQFILILDHLKISSCQTMKARRKTYLMKIHQEKNFAGHRIRFQDIQTRLLFIIAEPTLQVKAPSCSHDQALLVGGTMGDLAVAARATVSSSFTSNQTLGLYIKWRSRLSAWRISSCNWAHCNSEANEKLKSSSE